MNVLKNQEKDMLEEKRDIYIKLIEISISHWEKGR